MLALHLANRTLSLVEKPIPTPPPGEALIRVLRAGICNTDVELLAGYYPFADTLGHEFVGVVEQGPPAWVGRRVCGEINAACGVCPTCRAGRRSHCPQRTVLGIVNRAGVFAEYTTLPVDNLVAVPDAVSDDAAVFTEPLAAAVEILEQVAVRPTDRVVVVGDGKLANLIVQVLALTGARLSVVGKHAHKLALLAHTGAQLVQLGSDGSLPEPLTGDVVVEATGSAGGFALARRIVRPRGTLVLKSTYHGDLTLNMSAVVVDELTLVGSRCGPFAPALRLLAQGRVRVAPLIAARYPLNDALAAMHTATQPGVLKVLLDVRG